MSGNKIGILTFHFTDNPGSALQTYALQYILQTWNIDCEVINYQKKGWKRAQNKLSLKSIKKRHGILGMFVWLFRLPILWFRRLVFCGFQRKHIKITKKKISNKNKLRLISDEYRKIIVGSDQVWNLNNVKVDYTYFLDFVKERKKKISYGASFGQEKLQTQHLEDVKCLFNDFSYISVREIQGQRLIKDLLGRDVSLVLDPTLLLTQEQWLHLSKQPKERDYILVYLRESSSKVNQFVNILSEHTGLSVVKIIGSLRYHEKSKYKEIIDPCKWLGYFHNAKIVVTNSFHGIAFSINFRKPFFVEPRFGSQEEYNSRIYSILEQFGLQDRIINESINFSRLLEIDYKAIYKKLDEKRDDSIAFLEKALSDGDEI